MRKSGFYYSHYLFRDIKKKVLWLDSKYTTNKFLKSGFDARSLFIVCITLKLVDSMGKALCFCRKGKEVIIYKVLFFFFRSEKMRKEKKSKKKNYYYIQNKWILISYFF